MGAQERELVRRAKAGDPTAFAELYEQYQPKIHRYCFYRVSDPAVAEDLTAEVFVRMVESIDDFRYRGRPLLAWLYTIARNLVTDHYRHQGRATHLELKEGLVADGADLDHRAHIALEQTKLAAALAQLTEDQRQVILLKFFEGADNATTARILGKTVGAVKSLQHRALASLARLLGADRDG